MKNGCLISAIALCAPITFSIDAKADDFSEGWAFEVTPYAWLADINGDVTVNSTEARTKDKFSDLYDGVDLSGSLLGVVRKDRFLIWAQADYLGLDSDNLDAAPPNASLETYTTH